MIFSPSHRRKIAMNNARLIIGLFFLIVFTSSFARAQEWPQWRGPARDGSVSARETPAVWPESLQRTWRVEIGEGYSSPVVSAGRVYVHSRRDHSDGGFVGDELHEHHAAGKRAISGLHGKLAVYFSSRLDFQRRRYSYRHGNR